MGVSEPAWVPGAILARADVRRMTFHLPTEGLPKFHDQAGFLACSRSGLPAFPEPLCSSGESGGHLPAEPEGAAYSYGGSSGLSPDSLLPPKGGGT